MGYKPVQINEDTLKIIDLLVKEKVILDRNRSQFVHRAINDKIESLFILYPDIKDKIMSRLDQD